MADRGQRTEKPTQRKIRKAREDGQFAVSRDFLGSLQFVLFLAILISQGPVAVESLTRMFRHLVLEAFASRSGVEELHALALGIATECGSSLGIAGAGVVTGTLLLQLLQTKFGFSAKRLKPDLQRLNAVKKAQQLTGQNGPEFVKAVVLLPLFCWIVYRISVGEISTYMQLPLASIQHGIEATAGSLRSLLWRAAGLFVVVGIADFARSQYKYRRELRMSKQEIRDELKEVEGHPMIRARIRRLQRDMTRKQMMKEIPKATAVIVNPTHFAVAIRYDHESMAAPRVVAKGLDHLALRIRRIAESNGVAVVENKALSQALYRGVDIGQEIPSSLYRAVAEVLAFVFQYRQSRKP